MSDGGGGAHGGFHGFADDGEGSILARPRRGAEAVVTRGEWRGEAAVFKQRVSKGYRAKELDARLNAERTRREARMLHAARKAGVRTPFVLHADTPKSLLVLELLEGPTGKEVLDGSDDAGRRTLLRAIGSALGTMHAARLSHGDLTTSNMIWDGSSIGLLDLSLGQVEAGDEELGVDLRLFEEALASAHPLCLPLLESFYEGYETANPDAQSVRRKCEEIRARGRYR